MNQAMAEYALNARNLLYILYCLYSCAHVFFVPEVGVCVCFSNQYSRGLASPGSDHCRYCQVGWRCVAAAVGEAMRQTGPRMLALAIHWLL